MTPLAPGAPSGRPERIAVVGAVVSGPTAAHGLSSRHDVTLLEAEPWLGGKAKAVATAGVTSETVRRLWGFCLAYCEAGSAVHHLGVAQIRLARRDPR